MPDQLSDNLVSYASVIDDQTVAQAKQTASMPFVTRMAVMPDAHLGKGCCVGAVIATKRAVMPSCVGVDIGCVDADTEYLHPTGWRRIADYHDDEKVAQYDQHTRTVTFVVPQRYVVRQQAWFYHFKTKYGVDQMLTPDHKMLVWEILGRSRDRVQRTLTAEEFVAEHQRLVQGYKAEIETSFLLPYYGREKGWYDHLSLAEVRVQVMTAADASIDNNKMRLHLSKGRKIERAEKLLADAGIPYTLRKQPDDTVVIRYRPPLLRKDLQWAWSLLPGYLNDLAEEVLHWDGNLDDQVFFTRRNDDADLVQFAFAASGFRAIKRADIAKDGATDYRVFRVEKNRIGVAGVPKSEITKVPSVDGKAYCFTVPSGFLVLRRNGNIFITGNCGMGAIKTRYTWDDIKGTDTPGLDVLRLAIEDAIPLSPGNYNRNNQRFPFTRARHERLIQHAEQADVDLSHSPKWMEQLGSLGGGNHFIELCVDSDGTVWLFLHSGSRGVGNKIAQHHIRIAEQLCKDAGVALPNRDLAYLTEGTPEFDRYIGDLHWAQEFAYLNREEMLDRVKWCFARWLGVEMQRVEVDRVLCHHNYTEETTINEERAWLTRKGAIDASDGRLGLIPGSMGTSSYVVRGMGSATGLLSAPHGAGRKFSRTQAKKNFTEDDLAKAMEGIEYRRGKQWIDEIPGAYKDVTQVIADSADLVEVVTTLKQLLNVKGV